MSGAYDRTLLTAGSSPYERVATATVGVAALTLLVAAGVLVQALSIDRPVAGLTLAQFFGFAVLGQGAAILGLGIFSRIGLFESAPARYSGPIIGLIFGGLWFAAAGLVAAHTLALGAMGWYVVAPVVGLAVAGVTMVFREDVGTTAPVGLLLVGAGLAMATSLIGPGWAWSPAVLSVTLPAQVVVPFLAVLCSLLGGWTAGKASNGFGSRGQETGAYLLVSLVVTTVLAVLVLLIAFIASRGLGPVLENLTVGATAGLLSSLLVFVVFGLAARRTIRGRAGNLGAGSLLRITATGVAGLLAGVFAAVLLSGRALTVGGVTVAPVGRVGTGVALVVLLSLLAVAWSRYSGIPVRRPGDAVPGRLRAGVLGGGLVLTAVAGLALLTDGIDQAVGLALTPLSAALAVALAGAPALVLLWRTIDGQPVAAPVSAFKLGVAGGLSFLGLAVAFEFASGIVAVGSPGLPFAGVVTVAVAAQVVAVAYGVYAVTALLRGRGDADADWTSQATLAIVGVLGALTLLVVHAVLTRNELVVLDVLRVTPYGALDWPFVMNPSQGLGIQRGVMPAIIGTVWLVLGAVILAVPLAVGAAVYLTEYAQESTVTRVVEVATNGLWSTPSIVFGLFGLAFIVPRFGNSKSIFAGQLVLGFMLLPLVLITSKEAMQGVPDEYRDASAALGVSRWATIRSVVIPAAMPGVITGVILGIGRIAGETAPILLVMGGTNFPTAGPNVLGSFEVSVGLQPPFVHVTNGALLEEASALPYQLYALIKAGVGGNEALAWGTALVLLGVVLAFYAVGIASRRYFRRKLHQ